MPKLGDHQAALYAAEARTVTHYGLVWRDVRDVRRYVDQLLQSEWFAELWPDFIECDVQRRGNGSTWSTCSREADYGGVLLLAHLDQPTVLHELAHLLVPECVGHRELFAETLLTLIRHEMGFQPFAELYHELRRSPCFADIREGVDRARPH